MTSLKTTAEIKPEPTLLELSEKLDYIRQCSELAAKTVLNINEAAIVTSLSVARLYYLTSNRTIPHYKNGKRIYFLKPELEHWLLRSRVKTVNEIESEAETYIATHKK
ncbi:MAG: helix-turn-helix domain-containing protein [Bacteroides sp.]|nr:helix-turn-helix domain-containing protein [Bacteroides sp.]